MDKESVSEKQVHSTGAKLQESSKENKTEHLPSDTMQSAWPNSTASFCFVLLLLLFFLFLFFFLPGAK